MNESQKQVKMKRDWKLFKKRLGKSFFKLISLYDI